MKAGMLGESSHSGAEQDKGEDGSIIVPRPELNSDSSPLSNVTVPRSIPSCAGEGIIESVSACILPAGSSDGSLQLAIVTSGRLLDALNEMSRSRLDLSEISLSAVRQSSSKVDESAAVSDR